MDYLSSFGIILLAALIHTSFQVSVSVITLLSGHATRNKVSANRSLALTSSFLFGVMVMTMLLAAFAGYTASTLLSGQIPAYLWATVSGLLAGLGVAVWTFYYRRQPGTTLWIPRSLAAFLHERTRATQSTPEAFNLGLMSVLTEILFIAPPIAAAAFACVSLPAPLQFAAVLLYTCIASLGVAIVTFLVGGGHTLSRIQRWRENNKRFLQFAAGSGLIILGSYIYVTYVLTAVATSGGV